MTKGNKKSVAPKVDRLKKDTKHPSFTKYGLIWGSWKDISPPKEFLRTLGEEMLKWCELDTSLKLSDFHLGHRIDCDTWGEWVKIDKDFAHAVSIAKSVVGNRRERGALQRKFDATICLRTMPMYDKEYLSLIERQALLKHQDIEGAAQRIVVIERMPESSMVPMKREVSDEANTTQKESDINQE